MRILIIAPGDSRQKFGALFESVGFAVDTCVDQSSGARFLSNFDYDACVFCVPDRPDVGDDAEAIGNLRDASVTTRILIVTSPPSYRLTL